MTACIVVYGTEMDCRHQAPRFLEFEQLYHLPRVLRTFFSFLFFADRGELILVISRVCSRATRVRRKRFVHFDKI